MENDFKSLLQRVVKMLIQLQIYLHKTFNKFAGKESINKECKPLTEHIEDFARVR